MRCTRATAQVQKDLQATAAEPVPLHLRNAVTKLMRHEGYGKGYQYAHDEPAKVTDMTCLPESLLGRRYYQPTDQGFEEQTARANGRDCEDTSEAGAVRETRRWWRTEALRDSLASLRMTAL